MASLFSDHFNSSGTVSPGQGALAEELPLDSQRKVSGGRAHGRQRHAVATILVGTAAGIGDEIRMLSLPSNAILTELYFSSDGGATAGDADVGLYESGEAHDGAVCSAASVDSFSTTAEATDTEHLRVNIWAGGDFAYDNDIGKELWELVNVSDAATYAVDPKIKFDLVFTVTAAFTVAVSRLTLEAVYTTGD